MVSTNGRPRRQRSSRKSDGLQAGDAPPTVAAPARRRPMKPAVVRLGGRKAADWIEACARTGQAMPVRTRIRVLARAVRRGAHGGRRADAVEAAIAGCVDDAAAAPADRWLLCEAATWGLAWFARRRRAGGSAGSLLERLAAQGRDAQTALAARDTLPAPFVIALARLFADIEACAALGTSARASVAEEIGRLVTADGAVGLAGSTAILERVIRWTAARAAGLATGGLPWDDETDRRWARAASGAILLLGERGRVLSGTDHADRRSATAVLEALRRAGDHVDERVRRTARAVATGRTPRGRLRKPDLHDSAAALTVIRTGWGRDAVRVLVDYRDAVPRLEIAVADRLLVDGAWHWSAKLGGRPLEAEAGWTVACWESGRKAAFLEIVAPLVGGMQIERHVVVLRKSAIVLLADVVRPAAGGAAAPDEILYRADVPLAAGLDVDIAAETREAVIFDTTMRGTVLPLALPEWRGCGAGSLASAAGTLTLEQSGRGRLYAPLWFDCDASRVGRPLTWRQLTVADTRRNLPRHQAAGFRVQSGQEQWLLYRSLDVARNRTLLGCNVSAEFLLGRVKRSGEVARTLEIE
jgi:hypothetical protein